MGSPVLQSESCSATLTEGFKNNLPIAISYIPIAFAFGPNAARLGSTPVENAFFSCVIYTGISQLAITTILTAGSSLWVVTLTVMAMDIRHILYDPPLHSRTAQRLSKLKSALWVFGLADEVFATATVKLVWGSRRWSENWMIGIALCSRASWVFGTVIGASSDSGLLKGYPAAETTLGSMLSALFTGFLLALFQHKQTLCVTVSPAGALAGVMLFSIPAAILADIARGCLTVPVQSFWQGGPGKL